MSRPWHRWYHHTWLSSETRFSLSLEERGLYRDVLDLHYAEGSVPADKEVLRRMLGLDKEEFERAWENVSKHFSEDENNPDRLVNSKAVAVLEDAESYTKKQAENGRRGGLQKAKTKRNSSIAKASLKHRLSKPKASLKRASSEALAQEEENSSSKEEEFVSSTSESSPSLAPLRAGQVGELEGVVDRIVADWTGPNTQPRVRIENALGEVASKSAGMSLAEAGRSFLEAMPEIAKSTRGDRELYWALRKYEPGMKFKPKAVEARKPADAAEGWHLQWLKDPRLCQREDWLKRWLADPQKLSAERKRWSVAETPERLEWDDEARAA